MIPFKTKRYRTTFHQQETQDYLHNNNNSGVNDPTNDANNDPTDGTIDDPTNDNHMSASQDSLSPVPVPEPNSTTQQPKSSDHEVRVFKTAKKLAMIDCVKCFITCTVLLWSNACDNEHSSTGSACFEGWLSNKKTKDATTETANAVNNGQRQPLDTIGDAQSKAASQGAQSEFDNL